MGWLDLEESVEDLFAEFQDERDYEYALALNDIATRRGDASAERSKDWRAKQRLNPEWIAREQARGRARRAKKLTRALLIDAVENSIAPLRAYVDSRYLIRKYKKRAKITQMLFEFGQTYVCGFALKPTRTEAVIVSEQQLSFGW